MASEAAAYERVFLVKPDVFMYRIPPRTSNRAYRASEWKLDAPDWNGRLRIVSLGAKCIIKLEDKNSGDLFAACPVETYPSPAVESVSDSARYFVLKIQDDSGRTAFIGMGFADRSDSFDFNVALQDHFKYLKKDEDLANNPPLLNEKKLDLSFKEGQTIKINIGKKSDAASSSSSIARQKPKAGGNAMGILLPPPPGSKSTANASTSAAAAAVTNPISLFSQPASSGAITLSSSSASTLSASPVSKPVDNLLLDFDSPPATTKPVSQPGAANNTSGNNPNDWGLF